MRNWMSFRHTAAAAIACTLLCSALSSVPAHGETAPPDAIGAISIGDVTTYYYNTDISGGMTAMWNKAVEVGSATVTLYADWTSENGTRLVTNGAGMAYDGVICVPSGCSITVNLNGFHIDRALDFAIESGEVILVESGATLNLTDTKGGASAGAVTGGNSLDSAGGIQVAAGGTLNMWGGSISGNSTEANGGGVFLGGENSKFYMSGGSVTDNHAGINGGGIASAGGSIRTIEGSIAKNTAGGSGGGLYLQGGEASLEGGTVESNRAENGGGFCITADAALTLKGAPEVVRNIAVSANAQGCGGGILVMSSVPVTLVGEPVIGQNALSDGSPSNLVFWKEGEENAADSLVANGGIALDASFPVSFAGGKGRDFTFLYQWHGPDCFEPDSSDYQLRWKDGNLTIRRPFQMPETYVIVWILCGLIAVICILSIIIVLTKKKQGKGKKKKRRAKKSKKE